jgi:hypothetical protein
MEMDPFITVGKDDRGNCCWIVVGVGCRVQCATGQRALEILEAITRTAGNDAPSR